MQDGKVLKIYPFLGITKDLLDDSFKETKLRCGSGHSNFTINTKGDLSACPIINSAKNFYCGNINHKITKNIYIDDWCKKCKYLTICGGRCLYSNKAQLWPKEGHDLVCETIIHLIKEIKQSIPKIKNLIQKNKISKIRLRI